MFKNSRIRQTIYVLIIIIVSIIFYQINSDQFPTNNIIISNSNTSNIISTSTSPVLSVSTVKKREDILMSHFSSWLWDSPNSFTSEEIVKMLKIAKRENITLIYLRMDDYIDAYGLKNVNEREIKIRELDLAAERFIRIAKDYNIEVQALGGDTGWAKPDEIYNPVLLLNAIYIYNSKFPQYKFTGIQFDVESNNSPEYKNNKTYVLNQYLNFVELMLKQNSNINFKIGFAIPILYTGETNNEVIIEWNGRKKLISYHLIDILSKSKNSYLVLMAYRNYAYGSDGSISHSDNLIEYASINSPEVKIIVGQETDKVKPDKITFYDKNKDIFKKEVSKIVSEFATYRAFDGIAIHHLQSYIDL